MILDKLYNNFKNSPINDMDILVKKEYLQIEKIPQHKQKINKHKQDLLCKHKDEDKFNSNKRNSLKHISVNNIAQLLKNKLEQGNVGEATTNIGPPPMVTLTTNSIFRSTIETSNRPKSFLRDLSAYEDRPKNCFSPPTCYECGECVSIRERQNVMHLIMHKFCFKCHECKRKLDASSYEHFYDNPTRKCKISNSLKEDYCEIFFYL